MNQPSAQRRQFLKASAVLGAAGLAGCAQPGPSASAKIAYNPNAQFELKVFEVEYRRNPQGRALMARVYQPQGAGPFPVMVDLHGGAWNAKDRKAEQPMNRAVAASGVLVVEIDLKMVL